MPDSIEPQPARALFRRRNGRAPLTLILAAFVVFLLSPGLHADETHAGIDLRLVGSWKYDTYLGTVIFHTSFANGDYTRSVYDHGVLADVSKGKWSAEGNTFHIVFLRRAIAAHPDRFANIDQRFDQEIIEVSADSYVVHEPTARGAGLIKWIRIGGSDISQYKADGPDPKTDPASSSAKSQAAPDSHRP